MKRLTPQRRAYFICVQRKRERRRLVSRDKRRRAGSRRRRTAQGARGYELADVTLTAPQAFTLEHRASRRLLLRLIHDLRRNVMRGRWVCIDFRPTTRMFPSGTLLLLAELDRLRRIVPGQFPVLARYPKDEVVEQVLQQVGISSLVRLKDRLEPADFAENVRHWRHATGEVVDGRKLEDFIVEYRDRLARALTTTLYSGIVEAMTNSVQHAYPLNYAGWRADGVPDELAKTCRRWWMFSEERDGKLTVVFCDLGIGIPASVKDPEKWSDDALASTLRSIAAAAGAALLRSAGSALQTMVRRAPNASYIKAATELRKTRTKKRYRGNGLPDILDVVRRAGSGFLSIMSNEGVYRYNAENGTEDLFDVRESIMGTMIQWTIPVSGAQP